jgi:hypothetical protein
MAIAMSALPMRMSRRNATERAAVFSQFIEDCLLLAYPKDGGAVLLPKHHNTIERTPGGAK